MDSLEIPLERLNRFGRRANKAMLRKLEMTQRKEKAFKEHYKNTQKRREAMDAHLDKVRKATKQRKGKVNNPRFR